MALQLSGLLESNSVHDILARKNYQSVDTLFPFICAFVDKVTVRTENGELRNGISRKPE